MSLSHETFYVIISLTLLLFQEESGARVRMQEDLY